MPSGTRTAKVELKTSAAGVDAGLKDARRKLRAFERETLKNARSANKAIAKEQEAATRDAHKGIGKAGGLLKGAVMGLGAAAGFDLAGGIGGMVSDIFAVEKELTRFSIDANLSKEATAGFRDEVTKVSNATGLSRLELTEAAHAYQILTGDADGATKSTQLFADVANAAGASTHEIAETAASLRKNLGLDPKDFRKGFDVLLNLGHKGALELRDFAGEMSGLAPQFKQFGDGDSVSKLTEMGAAMEVVKLNFANASETATGFRAAMTAISKSKVSDRLHEHGVDVWRIDPKTKTHVKRDFFEIMADIKKKIPDQKILADVLGGRQEAFRAVSAMLEHYQEMVDLRASAANSDQVSIDSNKYMESSSGRIAVAWERIKNAIAIALTPERIDRLANAMIKAADAFAKAVHYIDKGMDVAGEFMDLGTQEGAERRDERDKRLSYMNQREAHNAVREGGNTDAAMADISREDQLNRRLQAQAWGVDWTKANDPKRFGDVGGRSGVYSSQEIRAIMGSAGGASNFTNELAKSLTQALNRALHDANIVVKADSNAIATTGSNAHIHSTRPGGRR